MLLLLKNLKKSKLCYQVDTPKTLPFRSDPFRQNGRRQFIRRQIVQRRYVVIERRHFAKISRRLPLQLRLDRPRRGRRPRFAGQTFAFVSFRFWSQQRTLPLLRRHRHWRRSCDDWTRRRSGQWNVADERSSGPGARWTDRHFLHLVDFFNSNF